MSDWIRRGYELQHLFLGRPIRPFHLAVMLATGTIAYTQLMSHNPGRYGMCNCDWTGHALGWVAAAAAVFLFLGWWIKPEWRGNQKWLAEWGLLLAVGVWLTRTVYVLISDAGGLLNNPVASAVLSFAWAVGAGGAYLLERYDHVMESESE